MIIKDIKAADVKFVVDTIQVAVERANIGNVNPIESDNYGAMKKVERTRKNDNYSVSKMVPRHIIGYERTSERTMVDKAIKQILKDTEIKVEHVEGERMDLAFDSSIGYREGFKLHLFLFELITFKENAKHKYITKSLDTLKAANIYYNGRDFKLSIYDKEHESDGEHNAKTRMEFRWVRYTGLDTEAFTKKTINRLENIESNYEELVARMTVKLHQLYTEEMAAGSISNFSEFVRKYNDYFYCFDIMDGVYKKVGLKGSCKNWIKKFKQTTMFECHDLKEVLVYRDKMVVSAKKYINK